MSLHFNLNQKPESHVQRAQSTLLEVEAEIYKEMKSTPDEQETIKTEFGKCVESINLKLIRWFRKQDCSILKY
jgi:hypothetical protein